MAKLADRVAYRLAGFVWTAIYSGLCSRPAGAKIERLAVFEMNSQDGQQPVVAA